MCKVLDQGRTYSNLHHMSIAVIRARAPIAIQDFLFWVQKKTLRESRLLSMDELTEMAIDPVSTLVFKKPVIFLSIHLLAGSTLLSTLDLSILLPLLSTILTLYILQLA